MACCDHSDIVMPVALYESFFQTWGGWPNSFGSFLKSPVGFPNQLVPSSSSLLSLFPAFKPLSSVVLS